jgi:hypothetical protein
VREIEGDKCLLLAVTVEKLDQWFLNVDHADDS